MPRARLTALLVLTFAATGPAGPLQAQGTEAHTSRNLRAQADQLAAQCRIDEAFPLLARLTTLAENYRANVGDSRARAEMARDAQAQLAAAQTGYARAREDCARKQDVADAASQPAAALAIPQQEGGTIEQISWETASPSHDGFAGTSVPSPAASSGYTAGAPSGILAPADEPRATSAASRAASKRFAKLLGRWSSPDYGGLIETYLEADGTLTGVILVVNKPMEEAGYHAGQTILRGWTPVLKTNHIWLMIGENGEAFDKGQWSNRGLIFISRDSPDLLHLPAGLEGGISHYGAWKRQ
jgi:hypothetical protein